MTIIVVLAAGCGGAGHDGVRDAATGVVVASLPDPTPPTPRVVQPPVPKLRAPAGFRVRRVPDAGAQLVVPAGWIALTRMDAVFPGTIQTLGNVDPRVVGPLTALGVPDSPLKLLVLAPARAGRFAATVTLVVTSSGDAPAFPVWARQAKAALLARSQVRGPVSSSLVRLPVGRSLRLAFHRTSAGERTASVAYLALGGGRVYYLALTARRHEPPLTDAFDTLARSLSVLPGAVPTARATGVGSGA